MAESTCLSCHSFTFTDLPLPPILVAQTEDTEDSSMSLHTTLY
ncbi:hypothetical protein CK203_065890 [Vitis vinifera]|uniref:Uncharacterized protein n=1 Tax=Vitis vinifera TaxID=29760 RepID=A0A438G594_VITVI|nr:hypothetical protein CK203_065890 [Vitis vinifera]